MQVQKDETRLATRLEHKAELMEFTVPWHFNHPSTSSVPI